MFTSYARGKMLMFMNICAVAKVAALWATRLEVETIGLKNCATCSSPVYGGGVAPNLFGVTEGGR